MQYMFLIYAEEAEQEPAAYAAMMEAYGKYNAMLAEKGNIIAGHALMPAATGKMVQLENGAALTTDGPFAETKEQLAGFYVLECSDLDEALEYAAGIPSAAHGSIEVRPLLSMEREA